MSKKKPFDLSDYLNSPEVNDYVAKLEAKNAANTRQASIAAEPAPALPEEPSWLDTAKSVVGDMLGANSNDDALTKAAIQVYKLQESNGSQDQRVNFADAIGNIKAQIGSSVMLRRMTDDPQAIANILAAPNKRGPDSFSSSDNAFRPDPIRTPVEGALAGIKSAAPALEKGVHGTARALFDMVGADDMAGNAAYKAQQADREIQKLTAGAEKGSVPDFLAQGMSSIATQTPGLVASALLKTPLPALGGMFQQTLGTEYTDDRDAGMGVMASLGHAVGHATSETGSELVPLGHLVKSLGKTGIRAVASSMLRYAGEEVGSEELNTVTNFLLDKAHKDPNLTAADLIGQMKDTAAQTAFQAPVMGGMAHSVHRAGSPIVNRLTDAYANYKANQAQQSAEAQWNTNGITPSTRSALRPDAPAYVAPENPVSRTLQPAPDQPAQIQSQPQMPATRDAYDPIAPNQDDLLRRMGVEPDPVVTAATQSVESVLGSGDPTAGLVASVMRGDALQPIHDLAAVRASQVLQPTASEGGLFDPKWLPDAAGGESIDGLPLPKYGVDSQEKRLANIGLDARDAQQRQAIDAHKQAAFAAIDAMIARQKAAELEQMHQDSIVPAAIDRAETANQINQALADAAGEGVIAPNAMQLALQAAQQKAMPAKAVTANTVPGNNATFKAAPNISAAAPNIAEEAPNISRDDNSRQLTQSDASIDSNASPALTMQQTERGQWLIKGDMAQHVQAIREALPGTRLVVSQQKGQALVQMPADKNTDKQGKAIRKALDHLLLSREQLDQRDAHRMAAGERIKARNQQARQIDHGSDDILQAVAKLGGINTEQALSEWWRGQPETVGHYNGEVPGNLRRQGVFAFKRGGQPIDTVIRRLEGEGYLPEGSTPNDLLDAIEQRKLHPAGMEEQARREFEARQQEEQANAPGEFQQAYHDGEFADEFTRGELDDATDYFELGRQQREAIEAAAEAADDKYWNDVFDGKGAFTPTEEQLDAIFGPEKTSRTGQAATTAGANDAGRTTAGAQSVQSDEHAESAQDGFGLASYTASDLQRQAQEAERQQRELERQRAAADKARQEEETRKEIRRRSEAAADTFVLGGNAEDNLTGQGGLFDAPVKANNPDQKMIAKSDGAGFATRDALRAAATRDGIPQSSLIEKRDEAGNWIGLRHEPDNVIDRIITDESRAGKVIGTSIRDLHSDDVYTLLMAASSKKQINAIADYIGKYAPRAAADAVKSHIDSALKQKGWATEESLYGGGLFDAPAETESQRLKRETDALRAKASDLIHANDHRSEDAGRALDDFNDKVIGPAEFAARLNRIEVTPAPDGKNSRFEQKIKIAANGVESLRASDVGRVLEQQQSHESLQALADYITQHRPDLSGTVQRDTAELKEENGWTDGPKRGKVGMMLAPGEVVLTTSGRETTPFPKFQTKTGKTTTKHISEVDKWLLQNAANEALSRGDTFNAPVFQSAADNPKNISQSDKDSAEEYLFGEQPAVKPSILKPLVGANNAESQSSSAQNTADNNDNWLNELFGIDGTEPAQQSVQRYTGRPKEVDFSLLVPKIRAFVSERIAEADDWAGRKYKHNKKQIHLDGDGPAKHESISISSANESRRRSTIDNLTHQANAAKSLIDRIERGENISHELAQAIEASDADIETIGKPRLGKTRNDQAEAYISNMLLGDRGYRYGKGTLAHLLLVEYENFASTLAASSAQNTGHSSENTAETPQDAASSAETVAAIDALIAEGERRRDAGESPRMSREGLAYPPPAGDGDAMSAMNWLSDAERQQLHDLKQSLPSAASEREAARARIKQKLERRGPSMNGGAIDSNEPKADYTDHYETDLFGNPLPNAGRKTRAAKPVQSGVHRNVHAAPALSGDTAAPAGDYRVRTLVGTESQRTLGARSIQSIDDLAKATSYLYRSAVERFDAIVTDSSGKPLAVVGAFKGAVDQASVYKATLVGEAVRIPGAAHIWFSHNHPSGTASLSSADRALYAALADTFDGSGIQPMGLIAVAGSRYASMEDSNKPIPRSSESMALPVVERELVPAGDDLPAITSPQSARDFANSLYKGSDYQPGMMLLNTQNQLAAWVPLPATAMGALRHSGGLNAIYRAISESNAGAVILVHGGELSERIGSVTLGQNIAAAVAKIDVRPLDIIDVRKPKSAAETGELIQAGPVYSKANDYTSTQGMSAKDLQAIIAKALPAHLRELVKVEQSRGNSTQQSAQSEDNDLVEADYDLSTKQITLYADAIPTPERALFVLSHELTHYGLDAKYGFGLSSILLEARNNPMIAKLANAIAADRGMTVNSVRQDIADALGISAMKVARSIAIHRLQTETANEALAELNAAIERNDFSYLQDRYGVTVPKMMRNDLRGRLARLTASVKAWLAKLTGKQATEYSDKQVWDLLAGVRETVRGGGKSSAGYSDGAAQHSREPVRFAESLANNNSADELRNQRNRAEAGGKYEQYHRLAGEVEARNVQARADMTAEQRRATPPSQTADVADQHVILVYNGKEMAHAPAIANAATTQQRQSGMQPAELEALLRKVLPAHLQGKVKVVRTAAELPQGGHRAQDGSGIDGVYLPATGELYLVADAFDSPERALFVLAHELTHYGLRAKFGVDVQDEVLAARSNMVIGKLADAIARDRGMTIATVRRELSERTGLPIEQIGLRTAKYRLQVETAEEALAELNAAIERNDFAYLQDRYGVKVPNIMRNDLRARISRFVEAIKGWLAKLTGKTADSYSDKQVWDLLAGVRETVRNGGNMAESDGAAQHSMAASSKTINIDGVTRPTTNSNGKPIAQTEEGLRNFWRWFGDSKVVDKDGKPLVVYHGSPSGGIEFFDAMMEGKNTGAADDNHALGGFYFTADPNTADTYARTFEVEMANTAEQEFGINPASTLPTSTTYPVYLSIQDPAELRMPVQRQVLGMAKDSGRDGAILRAGSSTEYVAFKPEQIKSAIGNQGTFNGSDPNIMRSTAPKQPAPAGFSLPEETKPQAAQRQVQDSMNRWQQVLEQVREQGGQVDERNDVYGAEERFHGRAATRIEDFAREEVEPLMQRLAESGHTLPEVEQFLLAQHAEEANARIREIDDSRDTAFGMEDGEAQSILAKFAALPDAAEFKRLANDFRSIADGTLALYEQAGIVSPEAAIAMNRAYQHYVPVKGGDEDQAARQGTGKGLSVNGKQKRRMGHDMRDEHVLENLMRDRQRAIILAEKNNVGTYLLDLIQRNPDPKLWTIDVLPKQKVLRNQVSFAVERNGQIIDSFTDIDAAERFIDREVLRGAGQAGEFNIMKSSDPYVSMMAKPMLQENEVQVYVKGQPVRIQLHDPILAGQYRRMGSEQMGRIVEAAKEFNRYLSQVYTGYNPRFFVKNVARDAIAGTINLTAEQGAGMTAKALMHWPRAGAAVFKFALSGEVPNNEYGRALKRYRAAGGSTGAAYMGDLERQANTLNRLYENYTGAMAAAKDGKPGRAAKIATRKLVGGLAHWFEVWNSAGENAFRLATFMAMEESGKTVAQSASMAKNVTVNFNRKGELTPQLGAAYLFLNPSVQGSQRMIQSLFGANTAHKAQAWALVGGMVGLALALAAMNRADDDDEWEAIPNSVKDHNMIIPLGKGRKLTIPLPYDYGFFVSLANRLDAVMHGESAEKAAIKLASSFFESFSPVGNPIGEEPDGKNVINVMPTTIKIVLQPAFNINGFGSPMRPDESKDDMPDNLKMYRGTRGSAYEKAAQLLSAAHGSPYENNWNDVSPETLKYWVQTLTGGTGKFLADSASLLNVLASGAMPESEEVPIYDTMVRSTTVKDARARFYDLGKDAKAQVAAWKRANEAGDSKAASEYEGGELLALGQMMDGYRQQATALRDLMAQEMQRDDLTLAEKRLKQKMYERQEADIYQEFIRQFKPH